MTLVGPIVLGLVALSIPFMVGMLAAWAWRWRGIATAMAAGPIVAILISLSRLTTSGYSPIVTTTLSVTIAWLIASIPGAIIGLAISTIADRRRRAARRQDAGKSREPQARARFPAPQAPKVALESPIPDVSGSPLPPCNARLGRHDVAHIGDVESHIWSTIWLKLRSRGAGSISRWGRGVGVAGVTRPRDASWRHPMHRVRSCRRWRAETISRRSTCSPGASAQASAAHPRDGGAAEH
jgi:hypothetical protein